MSNNIYTISKQLDTREELTKILTKEIDIVNSKIITIVDKLWKIRAISITLCIALIGLIGFSNFAEIQNNPIINTSLHYHFLLISCLFIPIFFIIIDASYNKRYQLFKLREKCISWFFHGGASDIELIKKFNTFKDVYTDNKPYDFPVFDIYGKNTFKANYETSLNRSLHDIRPLLTYSIQYALYSYLVFTHSTVEYRGYVLLIVTTIAIAYSLFVYYVRKNKLIKSSN